MKRFISVAIIALTMILTLSFSAFAEISPTAEPKPPKDPSNDSPTSPQTGDTAVYVGMAALFVAVATAVVAAKKVKQ